MTSKHGVTGLTRSAAIDYAEYGIRGNSVNLAGTETALVARFGAFVQEEAKAGRGAFPITAKMQSILQLNDPEHRLAKPKEQAAVIPFLLSDNASYLAGRVYATLMLPEEITILERSGARTREVFNTGGHPRENARCASTANWSLDTWRRGLRSTLAPASLYRSWGKTR